MPCVVIGRALAGVAMAAWSAVSLRCSCELLMMVIRNAQVSASDTAGAEQVKGIEGYPLVVVLANPQKSWVPLEGLIFIGAFVW